jgi:Flp pilus assembly protein TadG
LTAPLLLLILFGTADFGQMFGRMVAVQRAARAGTQYASVDQARWTDWEGMRNAALAEVAGLSGVTATASQFCTCNFTGENNCSLSCSGQRQYIRVVVRGTFKTIVPYPGIPSSTELAASSTLRIK